MNPDFTLIWPLSCPKDGDHFYPIGYKTTIREEDHLVLNVGFDQQL